MKRYIFIPLSICVVLCIFPSCHRCKKTDLHNYTWGLLDSMPAGTQVVFESSSGKLDTAVYQRINRYENISHDGDERCEGIITTYFEMQGIKFKRNLGIKDSLWLTRSSSDNQYNVDELKYHYEFKGDTEYGYSYPELAIINYLEFNDVTEIPIRDYMFKKIGSLYFSRKNGLIQIKYPNTDAPNDSIYTYKHVIQ